MNKQKTRRQKAVQKLDKYFSLWIRRKDADEYGRVSCFTCGTVKHWKEVHAGHFVTRGKWATRYEPLNVRVQCYACNIHKHGNVWEYGVNLEKEKEGLAHELQRQGNEPSKILTVELEVLAEKYKRLVSELE